MAPPFPQAGCRGRSPRRGNRGSPPVSTNVGGWAGGTTAHAKPAPPLMEGASHNKTTRPTGASCPSPRTQRQVRKRPSVPKAGCRGRSPRRGNRGSPPVPKTLEGGPVGQRRPPPPKKPFPRTRGRAGKRLDAPSGSGGTAAQAEATPPLKEGAGNPRFPPRPRRYRSLDTSSE